MIIENNFHSLPFPNCQDHLNGEWSPTVTLTSVLSRSYSAQHVVGHSEDLFQKKTRNISTRNYECGEGKEKDNDLLAMEISLPSHVPFALEHFLLLMTVCVVSLKNQLNELLTQAMFRFLLIHLKI